MQYLYGELINVPEYLWCEKGLGLGDPGPHSVLLWMTPSSLVQDVSLCEQLQLRLTHPGIHQWMSTVVLPPSSTGPYTLPQSV